MMNIGLIRGNLNRKADGNPELEKKFSSVETLYLISLIKDKEKVQTTNIILIMVVKTIVVRNLFSFEYEGSNPSLPTKIQGNLYFIFNIKTNICSKKELQVVNFETNKEKGNSGLGMAIAYFTTNGYIVSIPLNDTQDYDLIIEKNGELKTVQVKATGCKTASGTYQVALKSCGGTNGGTYKTLIETKIDFLFVLNEDLEMYLIPKDKILNKSTLNLCDKYKEYKVRI